MHYFIPFAIPKCCSVAALQCCSVAVCVPEHGSLTRRYKASRLVGLLFRPYFLNICLPIRILLTASPDLFDFYLVVW